MSCVIILARESLGADKRFPDLSSGKIAITFISHALSVQTKFRAGSFRCIEYSPTK